jgi:hypothetical protein
MSSDDKFTKVNQKVVVAVVEEELNSTGSGIIEEATVLKREPWWSYIWVSFSNVFL